MYPTNATKNASPKPTNFTYADDFNGSDYVCMTGASGVKKRPEMATAIMRTPPKSRPTDVPVLANIAISNSTAIGSPKHHSSIASTAATPLPVRSSGVDSRESLEDPSQQQIQKNGSSAASSPTPSQMSTGSGKSGKFYR